MQPAQNLDSRLKMAAQPQRKEAEDSNGIDPNSLEGILGDDRYSEAGRRLIETSDHVQRLPHYVTSAYHEIVEKYGLTDTLFAFTKEQKNELVDEIFERLKGLLIEVGKVKDPESLDPEGWETMFQNYFGMDHESLRDQWSEQYVIRKEDVDGVIENARGQLQGALSQSALRKLKFEDVEPGKQYLARVADEIGYPINLDQINTPDDLRQEFVQLHRYAHQQKELYRSKKVPHKGKLLEFPGNDGENKKYDNPATVVKHPSSQQGDRYKKDKSA